MTHGIHLRYLIASKPSKYLLSERLPDVNQHIAVVTIALAVINQKRRIAPVTTKGKISTTFKKISATKNSGRSTVKVIPFKKEKENKKSKGKNPYGHQPNNAIETQNLSERHLPVIRVFVRRDGQCLRADGAGRIGGLDQAHDVGNGARTSGAEEDERRSGIIIAGNRRKAIRVSVIGAIYGRHWIPVLSVRRENLGMKRDRESNRIRIETGLTF